MSVRETHQLGSTSAQSGSPERYDKSVRTIQRWLVVPPPGFPAPVKHHGRWLWSIEDLDAYDRALIQGSRQLVTEAA